MIFSHEKVYSKKSTKILKPYNNVGYLEVYVYENKKRVHSRIHNMVANVFLPNPDNKPIVNHKMVTSITIVYII